jgi:hypothetical protein
MEVPDNPIGRRTALKAFGAAAVIGGGGLLASRNAGAQMASTFDASDVTVSTDTGDVDAVHLQPTSTVSWNNFDVPVTKVRQLILARVRGPDGTLVTPTDGETQQTQDGWWPIYRETPWLFETGAPAYPVSETGDAGEVTLDLDGTTATIEVPDGHLSNEQYPASSNHTELFLSFDGDQDWDVQVRYATGTNGVPDHAPVSYQVNGGPWQSGTPQNVTSVSLAGDTVTFELAQEPDGVGAYHTQVVDTESRSTGVAAGGEGRPWSAGLLSGDGADFEYNGDGAQYAQPSYADDMTVTGGSGQKHAGTSGSITYTLAPSSGANAGGPIHVALAGSAMPDYPSMGTYSQVISGTSIGQVGPFLNGSYGALGPGFGQDGAGLFDNPDDGTTAAFEVELALLTTLHTDYDFAQNVTVPDDPNPDRLTPLAMGNADDVPHQFGDDTHALTYEELIQHRNSHPAIDLQQASFLVNSVNEPSQTGSSTTANTGGS